MQRKYKRMLSVLLCMLLLCAAVPLQASAETYTGTCGENLTWVFNPSSGLLTVSGKGKMDAFNVTGSGNDLAPWRAIKDQIRAVTIEEGVTSVGMEAFHDCHNLTTVQMPDSLMEIGLWAFRETSLESVFIPKNVWHINDEAFYLCVTIDESEDSWKPTLRSITVSPDNPFYSSEGGILYNKEKTTLILFPNADTRSTFTIPGSVTTIYDDAFVACKYLTDIHLPNSIRSIGSDVFDYSGVSSNIENWTNGVLYVDHFAVASEDLDTASLELRPDTVGVADGIFSWEYDLVEVVVPDSVKTIGTGAFRECRRLQRVSLPDSVRYIGAYAFDGTLLYENEKNWMDNALYIGNHLIAVSEDSDASFSIREGTICVSEDAFWNAESVTKIYIPSSVISGVFNTEKLTDIQVDGQNLYYSSDENGVLYDKNKTVLICYPGGNLRESFEIPESVASVETAAFDGCTHLRHITLPKNMQLIGVGAFAYCASLEEITIPDSVTRIDVGAFFACERLSSITVPASVQYILTMAFDECESLREVIYLGTQTQWNRIMIADYNAPLLLARRTYCPPVPLALNETSLTMHFKETKTLTASREVEWSSDNEKAVKVDASGKLTAVGKGKATITAADPITGDTAKCEVTVKYSFVQWLIRIFLFGWIWYK